MSKDSQEGLSLRDRLLKVQRHLSVSEQTIHVSQTHSKHTECTHTHIDCRQKARTQPLLDMSILALSNF